MYFFKQNWGEVSFIQVFRDDLEPTRRGGLDYKESFHVVLVANKNRVHVWRIEISTPSHLIDGHEFFEDQRDNISTTGNIPAHHDLMNSDDGPVLSAGGGDGESAVTGDKLPSIITTMEKSCKKSFLNISISKLVEQTMCPGLDVSFSACSGHFVCGSSYALISTSKESVKLWKLARSDGDMLDGSVMHSSGVGEENFDVCFKEWNTLGACKEKGQLLQASAAYSGRIACVYKLDRETKERNLMDEDKDLDTNNAGVEGESHGSSAITVYECESSGGKHSCRIAN